MECKSGPRSGESQPEGYRFHVLSTYCVRIRFRLGERVRIETAEPELALDLEEGRRIVLQPSPAGASIREAEQLALFVQPYATEAEALEAGTRWRGILEKAFARLNIGADFGDRAATGSATQYGLSAFAAQVGSRVLNDVHGVMVFECDPWPRFVRVEAKGVVGRPADRLLEVLRATVGGGIAMSERESLAYDLYSASFSTDSPDARFALLMMALETIIEPEPRDSSSHRARRPPHSRDRGSRSAGARARVHHGQLEVASHRVDRSSRAAYRGPAWRSHLHGREAVRILHEQLRASQSPGAWRLPSPHTAGRRRPCSAA